MDFPPPPYSACELQPNPNIDSILEDDSLDESTKQTMINTLLDQTTIPQQSQTNAVNKKTKSYHDSKSNYHDTEAIKEMEQLINTDPLNPSSNTAIALQAHSKLSHSSEIQNRSGNNSLRRLALQRNFPPSSPHPHQRVGQVNGKAVTHGASQNSALSNLAYTSTQTDLISTSNTGSNSLLPYALSPLEIQTTSFYEDISRPDYPWIPKIFTDQELNFLNQFCLEYQAIKTMTKPITGTYIPYGNHFERVYEKLSSLANSKNIQFTVSDSSLGSSNLLILLFGDALRDATKEIKKPVPRLPHCFEHDTLSQEKFKQIVEATFELNDNLKTKLGIISSKSVLIEY